MAPPKIPQSDSGQPLIPPKPLVCIAGNRPDVVPYIIQQTSEFAPPGIPEDQCGADDARDTYQQAVRDFQKLTEASPHTCTPFDGNAPIWCKSYSELVALYEQSIPIQLHHFGSDQVSHPFMDIVYHMDRYGIDDFRSGEVFEQVADDPTLEKQVRPNRRLTLLYPASGSHMTPLLIPLKLIDKGIIDSAKIICTEIDEWALKRVDEYLRFMASPPMNLFENLASAKRDKIPGYEVVYTFTYQGKKMEFVFGMNRGGDIYSPDKYVQEADFIVFHDGVYNDLEKPAEKGIANIFFKKLLEYSEGEYSKPRLVLSENQWQCSRTSGRCAVGIHEYQTKYFSGFYGCSVNDQFLAPPPRYFPSPDGRALIEQKFASRFDGSHKTAEPDIIAKRRVIHLAEEILEPYTQRNWEAPFEGAYLFTIPVSE